MAWLLIIAVVVRCILVYINNHYSEKLATAVVKEKRKEMEKKEAERLQRESLRNITRAIRTARSEKRIKVERTSRRGTRTIGPLEVQAQTQAPAEEEENASSL